MPLISPGVPTTPRQHDGLPIRPGFPLPPPDPLLNQRDLYTARRGTYAPGYNHLTPYPYGGYGAYGGTGYWPIGDSTSYDARTAAAVPDGYLKVQGQPSTAQVYVDGLYAGTIDDLARSSARAIDAGAHRLEVRADGYESASVDLRVDPRETTVYRAALKQIAANVPPVVKATPKTFYVIPGCYAGTSRPERAELPRGCDIAKLRVVPPQISRVERRPPPA